MANRSIGIGVVIAALVLGITIVGPMTGTQAYFQSSQVTGLHDLYTWQCILWEQTTQADFSSDIGINVNTTAIPNSVVLDNGTTFPSVYGLSGNAGTAFSLYNLSNSTWVSVAPAPANVVAGGALTYSGNGNLSAFQGGSTTFWEYNISTNAWRTRAATSNAVGAGAGLAYTGNGNVSATRGGMNTMFWEYNISTNAWRTRTATPSAIRAGGALVYTNNGNLSALRGGGGGGGSPFYQYNISTNTWTSKTDTPASTAAGAALAYTNNGNISALRGGSTAFWEYNISTDAWRTRAATPNAVGTGAALAYTGDGNISAFDGGGSTGFWRYNLSSDTWTVLSTVPTAVGAGGSLAYVPAYPSVYTGEGTLSSVVNNSGKSGTTWNSLIWNGATTFGVTNITFRVRASDTSFLPTDASPSWVTAGWPSPVSSGLPPGRYFQWQAILTTTDTSKTPRLDDVSLCYT